MYLADLRHNYGGVVSTDCMPLGVGYMKAVMDRDLPAGEVEVRVFAYPDDLLAAMRHRAPDILMVSNYVWNESLSLFVCRHAKSLKPDALTVMGGPNISVESERKTGFMDAHRELDVYVLGQGDFMACELVKGFLETGGSGPDLLEQPLPSCVQRRPDGTVTLTETSNHNGDVNNIPSPWLTGVMDKFFDNKMSPIIETNRGCPFHCTFCVQGTQLCRRVAYFDLERLREEIHYIGGMIRDRSPNVGTLRIADANYGMYERDVEISGYIGEGQKEYGWPMFIDATTGKNRPDLIIRSVEKLNGALMLYQAVQSLSDEVLRNVRRSNIKLEAYEKIQEYVHSRDMESMSDLILGLPGESMCTHIGALHKLVDAGTNQAHCFQAMMLKGADLESLDTRRRFRFDTRYRVLPKNHGMYEGEKVFAIEEIVVATDTLPFEDYIQCRKHHLAFSLFWNDSWLSDATQLAATYGIKPSQWLVAVLEAMEDDRHEVHQLLNDFTRQTESELFASREACAAFYAKEENFERLCRGEIGDNLLYKCRAKASFFMWPQVCACAMDATRRMLLERGAAEEIQGFDEFWRDFHAYVEAKHASGATAEEITAPAIVPMRYDIRRWIDDGMSRDVGAWRHADPRQYIFRLSQEGARELRAALKVWTSKLTGLAKMITRIRVSSQVRRCELLGDDRRLAATDRPG